MGDVTPINAKQQRADAADLLEQSVLGGMLLRPKLVADIAIDSDDFRNVKHQCIHVAMRAVVNRGAPLDISTLADELARMERLDAVGGFAALGSLAMAVPTPENAQHYASQVVRNAELRRLRIAAAEIADQAETWPDSTESLLAELRGRIDAVAETRGKREVGAKWAVPLPAFMGDDEPSDDDTEDWSMRDLIPRGEAAIWAAPMKGGKTWAALSLLLALATGRSWLGTFENCHRAPIKAMGIFLEDGQRRLTKRVWELCRGMGISPRDQNVRENLSLSRVPFALPDRDDERRLTAEIIASGAQVVIVDNLTRVMVGDPNSTRDASEFTKAWLRVCNATGASVVFLHHTKKAQEEGAGARPDAGDPFNAMRGSGDFGAAPRNMIVARPLQIEGRAMSEVFMRGNLDLRRESFALAFRREQVNGRWQAVVSDDGDAKQVKADARELTKQRREEAKRAEATKVNEQRRAIALGIVQRVGNVTGRSLAEASGVSQRTADTILLGLEQSQVLKRAGQRGYVFSDSNEEHS